MATEGFSKKRALHVYKRDGELAVLPDVVVIEGGHIRQSPCGATQDVEVLSVGTGSSAEMQLYECRFSRKG
jgi:hypothetical protein